MLLSKWKQIEGNVSIDTQAQSTSYSDYYCEQCVLKEPTDGNKGAINWATLFESLWDIWVKDYVYIHKKP